MPGITNSVGNPDAFDAKRGEDYTGYRQETTYEYDPGVFILPVASTTEKPPKIVRVHGGLGRRVVKFAASKKGTPPVLPAATDTDRDTLVGSTVVVPLPAFDDKVAGYHWQVGGTYTYVTTGLSPTSPPMPPPPPPASPPTVEDQAVASLRRVARVPGRDALPAGVYPFPLPVQDTAAEALLRSSGTSQSADNPTDRHAASFASRISEGGYLWPFTVMPPTFFNPLLLRETR
jgi:hypothetical protein